MDSRIIEVIQYLNSSWRYESVPCIILDVVLLPLAMIVSSIIMSVAILPKLRIAKGNGVRVTSYVTKAEVWLKESVDYTIIQYSEGTIMVSFLFVSFPLVY